MRNIVMLCVTGTSCYGNIKSLGEEAVGKIEDVSEEFARMGDWIEGKIDDILDKFMEENSKDPQNLLSPRYVSAETQSVVRWIVDNKMNIDSSEAVSLEICFFPSKDGKSIVTAYSTYYTLKKLHNESRFPAIKDIKFQREAIPIDVSEKVKFNESVEALFKVYDEKVYDEKVKFHSDAGKEIIINATGGYKAICAYSSLYAQIKGLTCIYTFESDSHAVIEMLPMPVGYDMDQIDEEISQIKAYESRGESSDSDVCRNVPERLRGVIEQPALRKSLIKYRDDYKKTGGAYGRGMLDILRKSDDGKLWADYLQNRISCEWSELWLGDQIPETVEHSRKHSKRLMELAANFYRAAPDALKNIGLDKAENIALLISAIFLHDIGHTVLAHPVSQKKREKLGGVFPLGLFPSCVREMHHLLSAELIRERKDYLFPGDGIMKEFMVDWLRQMTPLLSEHHRGYTALKIDRAKAKPILRIIGELLYGRDAFEETLTPLMDRVPPMEFPSRSEERSEEIVKTTALLRVLDGCDVQADRTVGKEYMQARLERTREEAHAIWWQLKPFLSKSPEELRRILKKINLVSENITTKDAIDGNLDPDTSKELKDLCNEAYYSVFDILSDKCDEWKSYIITPENDQVIRILSMINRYVFKWEQFLHFFKHRCVSFTMPVADGKGGISVEVWPVESEDKKASIAKELKNVVDEITKEIKNTGDILKELNIKIKDAGGVSNYAG